MPFSNTSEIIDYVLTESFEPTIATSEFRVLALDHLNRALKSIAVGGNEFLPTVNENWWWLRQDSAISMKRLENLVETVTLTLGNTTNSFSSGPAASYQDYHIRIEGNRDTYKIVSHNASDTNFTLDQPWAGATISGATAEVFKIDYDNVQMGIGPYTEMKINRNNYTVSYIDPQKLDQEWPLSRISGSDPTKFTVLSHNGTDNTCTVRFNKFWRSDSSNQELLIRYRYLKMPDLLTDDTSSIPEIPFHYRHVLADAATFMLLDTKEDDRSQRILGRTQAGIKAMSVENRLKQARSGRSGQILTRPKNTIRDRDNTLRTETGLIIG